MYLSSINIQNFRGIKNLDVKFQKEINIIVGENGSNKTALIDAIGLLYNLGNQQKDIYVKPEDFHTGTDAISITYIFNDLSDLQKGAFHEYVALGATEAEDFARIKLLYKRNGKKVAFNFVSGETDDHKASYDTLANFKHCYLGALRDSTKSLLSSRNNILTNLINRQVDRNKSEKGYKDLISNTNEKLLDFHEVKGSRTAINSNLEKIYKGSIENQIGLHIESAEVENIVNIIKPFLPHDKVSLVGQGLSLNQNSLGFNNLIYIATVMGDIHEEIKDDSISHYSLLIEEPEAHLHPQLQVSLFEFLKNTKKDENSQVFITTHSPTLTSRVPLDNLIHINKNTAIILGDTFKDEIIQPKEEEPEDESDETFEIIGDAKNRKKQLERYIDVTRSQLFYSKGILFVEGISEELLIPLFSLLTNQSLLDHRIEIVNVDGTSFYPFLSLFVGDDKSSLNIKSSVITDDDRFPESKDSIYSFKQISQDPLKLAELYQNIQKGKASKRLQNIQTFAGKTNGKVTLWSSYKTFEYDLIKSNIPKNKADIYPNPLVGFILDYIPKKKKEIIVRIITDLNDDLSDENIHKLTILLWKSLPSKAQFAQDLSIYIQANIDSIRPSFIVPKYIQDAFTHLIPKGL